MDKLVFELKHCGSDVDNSRIELMLLEMNQLVGRFGYSIPRWGTREKMTKALTDENQVKHQPDDPVTPVTRSLAA